MSSDTKYRPDIDGLRAFAVLAVVIFHAFPTSLTGGFVGVDVFFVISGYLISTIIFSNLERGTFSFAGFYARRIRRIFPALLLVLFCCLAFGWVALLVDEYKQLGKHTMAGAGFVSNFAFWSETGYFDSDADTKPLLHLWSLGIEEQFYIFWPLLVWFAWRSKLGLLFITICVLSASFALNVYSVGADPAASFYSPLARIWELSVGSLLAYLVLHKHIVPSRFSTWQANSLSIAGVLLLLAGVIVIDRYAAFPGWWVLLPVLGSALVITAGSQSWLSSRILSNRIVVWFGLISYPLYLWHWPILSFGRIIEGGVPGAEYRASAVLLAILLAWLTYRLLEQRVRSSAGYQYVGGLLAACVTIAAAGAYVFFNDGIPDRQAVTESGFTPAVSSQFAGPFWEYEQNDLCLDEYPFDDAASKEWWFCIKSDARKPSILILGNSFANQQYPGFINNSYLSHHTVLSIGNCPFVGEGDSGNDYAGKNGTGKGGKYECDGQNFKRWEAFVDELIVNDDALQFIVIDGLKPEPDAAYIERLRQRVSSFEAKGVQVIIFTPHLRRYVDPKSCFSRPFRSARDCTFPVEKRQAAYAKFLPAIEELSRSNPNVLFFEQNDIFCDEDRCSTVSNGMPLHRDASHLSVYASIELQRHFTDWAKKNAPEILSANLEKSEFTESTNNPSPALEKRR